MDENAEPLGRGEPPPRSSARRRQPVRIALLRPTVIPGGGRSPVALGSRDRLIEECISMRTFIERHTVCEALGRTNESSVVDL